MARIGIDFGTTNTVAAVYERGVFSVVQHQSTTAAGTVIQELFPSVILIDRNTGQRWFGPEADRRFEESAGNPDRFFVASLKRQLRDYSLGQKIKLTNHFPKNHNTDPQLADNSPQSHINEKHTTELPFDVEDLLTDFLRAAADSIRRSQSFPDDEPLEAVITWPANANGAQRHITRKCFRNAGFQVIGTVNEPTASAVELVDLILSGRENQQSVAPGAIAVFDLGGGTFDASVVWVENHEYHVLASAGIESLGGDDFDRVMIDMFLEKIDCPPDLIGNLTRHAMLRQARAQKELISAGAMKSLFFNPREFGLKGRPISIPIAQYHQRIQPMLEPAVKKLADVINTGLASRRGLPNSDSLTIYLVGGSSRLPLVGEMISKAFDRHTVVLTDKPFRSVAMGAAICATDRVTCRDVFSRHFGLFRLKNHGRSESFDVIFPAGTPIPRRGESPIEKSRHYNPAHNIGHLRFLECTSLNPDGLPDDGVRKWSDILFPYDPAYSLAADLNPADIFATDRFAANSVCETYRCDQDGVITVELKNPARDESRCYEIYNE